MKCRELAGAYVWVLFQGYEILRRDTNIFRFGLDG